MITAQLLGAMVASSAVLAVALAAARFVRLPSARAAQLGAGLLAAVTATVVAVSPGRTMSLWSLPSPPAATASLPPAAQPVRLRASPDLAPSLEEPPPARQAAAADVVFVLASLWAVGTALLLLRLVGSHLLLRRLCRRSTPIAAPPSLEQLARRAGVSVPKIVASPEVASPFLARLPSPVLFMPSTGCPEETADAVYAHELAHLRRRDCEWSLASAIACALLWPQPLAWLAARRREEASEIASDAAAAEWLGSYDGYARSLVELARRLPASAAGPATASVVSFRSTLGRRIQALVDQSAPRSIHMSRIHTLIIAGAACALAIVAPAFAPAQQTSSTSATAKPSAPISAPAAPLKMMPAQAAQAKRSSTRRRDLEAEVAQLKARVKALEARLESQQQHQLSVVGQMLQAREAEQRAREQLLMGQEKELLVAEKARQDVERARRQEALISGQAGLEASMARLAQAEASLERATQLYRAGTTTQAEVEAAKADLAVAKANLDAAQARMKLREGGAKLPPRRR